MAGMVERVEQLAELLVLADYSDPKSLADIHTAFDPFEEWAVAEGQTKIVSTVVGAKKVLEQIILDDIDNPAHAFELVGEAIGALQQVLRDGRDADSVSWPEALWPDEQSGAAAPSKGESPVLRPPDTMPAHIDSAIFADFLVRQASVLEDYEQLVLALEKDEGPDSLNALRRIIHTLKGEAGMLGLHEIERLTHAVEDVLEARPVAQLVDILLTVRDWLGKAFDYYAGRGAHPGTIGSILQTLGVEDKGAAPGAPAVAEEPEEGQPLEGDPDLLREFIAEANEHLEKADLNLLTLETETGNQEALNAVFRAFHTIKGVAGFLGLEQILSLSHEAENLLDVARKGEIQLIGTAMDVTFDAVDMLKRMIGHVANSLQSGSLLPPESGLRNLLGDIRAVAAKQVALQQDALELPPAAPGQRLGEILVSRGVVSDDAIQTALSIQQDLATQARIGEILVEQGKVTGEQIESAIQEQHNRKDAALLGEVLVATGAVTPADVNDALRIQEETQERPPLGEVLVQGVGVPAKDVAQALRSQRVQQQPTAIVKEPVKVDADRLDHLVDMIGELVIAESMVVQSRELQGAASTELARHLNQLDKITRELQEMGMSLRMVPIRSTFQKMARLVRDLAKKSGKQVDFVTTGEDTELDKTVVDKIGDPLVHMVRNAVDHGLETPEQRREGGKSAAGRVELRAFHKGGNIFVEIQDDGRGIDKKAVMAKAIERGLVREGDTLSDREIYNLIFLPGFSTAKTVTDISGRGVGMDVVKRNIEALRGQIEIQSELGSGSLFSIRLPLTLAIIDGMVVRVGSQRYIIPTLSILMSIRPESKQLSTVTGRGNMLLLQGKLLPLFHISRMFSIGDAIENPTEGILVVVEEDGRQVALLIDEILGQQQIVIKSLGETFQGIEGISGGAIMPDGTVGLILDIGSLVKLANA